MSTGALPALAALNRFIRGRPGPNGAVRCGICGADAGDSHSHLALPGKGAILCACRLCVTLLGRESGKGYRAFPEKAEALSDFRMTEAQWDALGIPVGMAFFFFSSPARRIMAFYPSPAGAMESLLPLGAWRELAAVNPVLETLAADVEALLVNRIAGARECYRAPIVDCYRLVGLVRLNWKGFSAGPGMDEAIRGFFENLRSKGAA